MVYKFRRVARTATNIARIECEIWCTDRRDASLRLNGAIIQITRACAPETVRYARFLNDSSLNS